MPTATTRRDWIPAAADTLYLALDLGNRIWKLACTTGAAQPPRIRTIAARDLAQLEREIAAARARFGLAPDAPAVSCYEAGRDGFWVHRALTALGVTNHVVDSASIEGNRRGRQTKSDRLDAAEFFAWRHFRNRREVGALAGLCGTMRRSGGVEREQGISKAGNHHIRALAIELAWSWLRRQPRSALTLWYRRRFATGGPRVRRIGIVALARKLLIALWRYLETGVLPEGAMLKA